MSYNKIEFDVSGMSCAACAAHIERAVSKLEGVKNVSVNLLRNYMQAECEEGVTAESIIAAVERAGYGAAQKSHGKQSEAAKSASAGEKKPRAGRLARLWASVVFLVLLMYLSMGHIDRKSTRLNSSHS